MTALPKGSTILVTGGNGYIGSHVIDQSLKAGLRVRAAVRSVDKGQHLKAYFEKVYPSNIDYVLVEDIARDDAYVEAIKGVTGVIHVASVVPRPGLTYDDVIVPAVGGTLSVLRAAAKEPSVKRVVVTSSSVACGMPQPDGPSQHWDATTWNEATVSRESTEEWALYVVSKIKAERAAWDFVKDEKPGFTLNTILPNANLGRVLPGFGSSTAGWIRALAQNEGEFLKAVDPQWFINVEDTARLHVIVLLDTSVANERIWAVTAPFTWNEVVREIRKVKPDAPVPDDFFGARGDRGPNATIDFERAKRLLAPNGLKDFAVSIKETLED